jgi:hypothetical protein
MLAGIRKEAEQLAARTVILSILGLPNNLMYKNRLQEYTQKSSLQLPVYQTFNEGHAHMPRFRSTVWVDGAQNTSQKTSLHRKADEQDVANLALAFTAAEVLWLTHLLHDLQVPMINKPLLLCDNKSAIFLGSNPVSHKRAKHIDIDYHFLRELVTAGKIHLQHVPSHLQLADIFTKSASKDLYVFFRSKLRVSINPTLSLRGAAKDHTKSDGDPP